MDALGDTAGALATLTGRKIHIPKECMGVLGWSLESQVQLIVELIEFGRVRLHLREDISPKIEAKRTAVRDGDAATIRELLGAMDDKYREVAFYTKGSERTLYFDERTVVYLGILPNDQRKVFVEATKQTVDIMSLTYRNQRLELLKDEISV